MEMRDLQERKGKVIGRKYVYGKEWDVLDSFLLDPHPDQDYFLLSFNNNKVYANNYYGYVVVITHDEVLFSGL